MINYSQGIEFILEENCPKKQEITSEEIENSRQKWLQKKLPLSWIKKYSCI